MRLWLLKQNGHVGYDEYDGFVIRAASEQAARRRAASAAGDEGATTWTDWTRSSCMEITPAGRAEIVLGSFCAG